MATFSIPLPLSLTFSPVADTFLSPSGLWIGNLPKDAADAEIKPMFACYGPVHGIKVEALFDRISSRGQLSAVQSDCHAARYMLEKQGAAQSSRMLAMRALAQLLQRSAKACSSKSPDW